MSSAIPVVDLFSGPGGLAEGFSAFGREAGQRRFRIALSVESEANAHRTLRLRAFLHKFDEFPPEYYDFLQGDRAQEPDWSKIDPRKWSEADREIQRWELGSPDTRATLRQRIEELRKEHGGRTVLLGGPPCQSYSLIGRARNAGNHAYNPGADHRQMLYQEYVQVLEQLQPAVAVMENVRGLLSAQGPDETPIFPKILSGLQNAGGEDRYQLLALTPKSDVRSWQEGLAPEEFLVEAEKHGVPQKRHRIFVVCVRRNLLASELPQEYLPRLEPSEDQMISVQDVIGDMPMLRSHLSQGDTEHKWREAVSRACKLVEKHLPLPDSPDGAGRFRAALARAREATRGPGLPPPAGRATGRPARKVARLQKWLGNKRLGRNLPNHEARGHMAPDLERYLFAAIFADTFGRSPRCGDFPSALAPDHVSWDEGIFSDRYRVQLRDYPSTTVTSHIAKDGHYFIHYDPAQCRSLTVREAARLQTFPDDYFFQGSRSQQYIQVGNAVPPFLALQIAETLCKFLDHRNSQAKRRAHRRLTPSREQATSRVSQPVSSRKMAR